MFEMRRGHAIRGAHGPAIFEQSDVSRAHVNHRLDRQASCLPSISDRFRACRNLESAVPRAFFDQLRAQRIRAQPKNYFAALHLRFPHKYRRGDRLRAATVIARASAVSVTLNNCSTRSSTTPTGDRCSVVPDPAVLDDADVELNDVAVLNPSLAADAVDNFVV